MSTYETLRAFVNTWECDENAHMNVQFYYDRFEVADLQFQALAGLEEAALGARGVRRVRYLSEMMASELILVRSAVVRNGPHPVTIVHQMSDPTSGRLTATALDGYPSADPTVIANIEPELARSRSQSMVSMWTKSLFRAFFAWDILL